MLSFSGQAIDFDFKSIPYSKLGGNLLHRATPVVWCRSGAESSQQGIFDACAWLTLEVPYHLAAPAPCQFYASYLSSAQHKVTWLVNLLEQQYRRSAQTDLTGCVCTTGSVPRAWSSEVWRSKLPCKLLLGGAWKAWEGCGPLDCSAFCFVPPLHFPWSYC